MEKKIYEIMHMDRKAARIDTSGNVKIYFKSFMPYNLYLEEGEDIDTLVNNVTNFNYWCSTRMLTLDRKYVKAILNSINVNQAVTDKDRAQISLTYHCASLTDVFWVRTAKEKVSFSDINLYENHLDNTFMDIALRGKQYTVDNEFLAKDLSTNGCYPKAWKREPDKFILFKDGGKDSVERELLASKICQCFDVEQVVYEEDFFDGEIVTRSENITSGEYSIASLEALQIYIENHDKDIKRYILRLDKHGYYMMNIIDYLTGNTDRHWGNWGVLVKNKNNKPVKLHPLMDFNQTFNSYDTIDGANCQTVFDGRMTQREAAIEAVSKIGLNQIKEVKKEYFDSLPQFFDMFSKRYELLKDLDNSGKTN